MTEQVIQKHRNIDDCSMQKVVHQMSILEKKYEQLSMSMEREANTSFDVKEKSCQWLSDYVRKGDLSKLLSTKASSLSVDNQALLSGEVSAKISNTLTILSPVRNICSVEVISKGHLDVIKQEKTFECKWGCESEGATTESPEIKAIQIHVHDLYASPKASQNLLDDTSIDIENWIVEQLGQSFAQKENQAFFSNEVDSTAKPEGLLAQFNKSQDQLLRKSNVAMVKDAGEINLFKLLDLKSKLTSRYQANAVFVMHRETLQSIIGIKDTNDRFIFQPKTHVALEDTLLGVPVICSDDMPSINSDQDLRSVILIGDFKSAYTIVEHSDLPLIRDPYTHKPYISFYARKRIGGKVVEENALCSLVISKNV